VESCPEKDAIFKVIRTWEKARSGKCLSESIKNLLVKQQKRTGDCLKEKNKVLGF